MPKPGPRTTYRYSDAFEAAAVRLNQLPGVAVRDVAGSLCIHPFMLPRWRRLAREGQIVTKGVDVDPAVAAETKALRRKQKRRRAAPLTMNLYRTSGLAASPNAKTRIAALSKRQDTRSNQHDGRRRVGCGFP